MTRASAGLHRRGWEVETKLLRGESRRLSRAGGDCDRGCVAGLSVVWCARSGSERCAVFWWGDAGQHVEVWSSSRADASCYETACLI